MKTSSIIITSLFLGVGGALAATLFAPNKGAKTRKKIAKRGQEYKDYLVDNYNDLVDTVSHPFENLEEETKRLGKKANAKAKEIKKKAKKIKSKAKQNSN